MEEIAFGPFSLDLPAGRLYRDGQPIKLRRQAFRVLTVLALHGGRYVGYEQLMAEAWDGTSVSRHTIDVTVGEARRTLEDCGGWIQHRPKGGYCLEVPTSEVLIRRGRHFANLRTRQGFERALEAFEEAAAESPRDHRTFQGQAACYLLLASLGMQPGREMYARFLEAHRRAYALVGPTPDLRCDRAHGLHMHERRLADAEADFQQAVREKPASASAHVRMTMLYVTLGRLDTALDCVARAAATDPLWPLVPATEVSVRFWRREYETACALGAKAVELHPYFLLGRAYYGQALEFSGRIDEAIAQYRTGRVISQGLSWLRALEGVCLVKIGRSDEAAALLAQLEDLRRSEYVCAYRLALLRHALGQQDEAFAELSRAVDEGAGALYALLVDPKADPLRSDPRFPEILRRYYGGPPPPRPRSAAI